MRLCQSVPPVMAIFSVFCLAVLFPSSCTSSDPDDPLSRFQAYLRIPSAHPHPDYASTTSFLLSQASQLDLPSRLFNFATPSNKPVVLISFPGLNSSLPSVLLNSHTDVVPAEPGKWRHPPFAAVRDADGNIYGRGSQDAKSVGMQYLEALRRLRAQGFQPLRSVHVSFVPDEEVGGAEGMGRFVESPEFAELNVGVNLDEGLACQQGFYRVFVGERAVWKLVVKARGEAGHGARMAEGSAMENLRESLNVVYEYREKQFRMLKEGRKEEGEVVAINVVFLNAGIATPSGFLMNLQPSEAEAGFDIRVPPFVDMEDLETEIRTKWAPASRNLTYTLTPLGPRAAKGVRMPATASAMNPWWDLLQEAVARAGGKLGAPMIRPSATDSRYIRNLGTPAFGFSPMANTPSLLHDHNEFLNAREYLKGIEIYTEIIKAFLSHVDISNS